MELRNGGAPVKCPFTYPNTARASSVIATDATSAVDAFGKRMYGPRGMNPPTMYAPAIVNALSSARFGSGFSSPNSNRIMKSTQASGRLRKASTIGLLSSSVTP